MYLQMLFFWINYLIRKLLQLVGLPTSEIAEYTIQISDKKKLIWMAVDKCVTFLRVPLVFLNTFSYDSIVGSVVV